MPALARLPTSLAGLAVAAALAAPGPAAAAPGAAPGIQPAAPTSRVSWTARVYYPVAARSAPRAGARVVGRLQHYTAFSRSPQVLMVTGFRQAAGGRAWVRVQLPTRPNGSNGWVPQAAVGVRATHTRLRVRVRSRRVEVYRSGRRVASFRAAVGTGGTPTPLGTFAIQDPVRATGAQAGYLGPYILTLTAYSRVLRTFAGGNGLVAIHGTNAPGLLGRAVSHGCVRVSNESVTRLRQVARPGVPVEIVRT